MTLYWHFVQVATMTLFFKALGEYYRPDLIFLVGYNFYAKLFQNLYFIQGYKEPKIFQNLYFFYGYNGRRDVAHGFKPHGEAHKSWIEQVVSLWE